VFIYFGSSWLYGPIAVVLGALNQLMHTVFSWMS
jgi:hypothetical protein